MSEELSVHTGVAGCQCGACATSGSGAIDASMDGSAGSIVNGKTVWTVEQIADHLGRSGTGWLGLPGQAIPSDSDHGVINFGFHTSPTSLLQNGYFFTYFGRNYAAEEYFNFAAFSDAQKESARSAMDLWDDLISVTFAETSIHAADIAFGNLAVAPSTQAYALLPGGPIYGIASIDAQVQEMHGDVWISLSQATNLQLGFGEYGAKTLIHEVGHALGLSHPGAYNAGQASGPPTYAKSAEYAQDSRMYSVMSYFNAEFTGAGHIDWNKLSWVSASTPLLHDIAAIQAIYGADLTTRTGDTVYGFNSTADRDVYDFDLNEMPVLSIYDAGGVDTLDFSGWNSDSVLDLNPGAFSSGGGSGVVPLDVLKAAGRLPESYTEEQYLALRARYHAEDGMLSDNISIAYNTIIENAVGGGGNDTITGNAVSNQLNGGAGDDLLAGGDGIDYLTGGAGNDIFVAEIDATKIEGKSGPISFDVVLDFELGDRIDLSGIDADTTLEGHQAFDFVGHAAANDAGQLQIRHFGNMNAAENALGLEIDGVDGKSAFEGPVSVLFGNVDGGAADFAMVFVNTPTLTTNDFIF